MDLECFLFKIHKSILSLPHTQKIVGYSFKTLLIVIFFLLIHFILLNLNDKTKPSCLGDIQFMQEVDNKTIMKNETIFNIIVGNEDETLLSLRYCQQYSLLLLSDEIAKNHTVEIENHTINSTCYLSSLLDTILYTQANLDTLVIGDMLQIMETIKGWHFLLDNTNHKLFRYGGKEESENASDQTIALIFRLFRFGMRCFFYTFFQTCYASLIIKVIQFGIPVVMNAGWYRLYQRMLINNNKSSPQMICCYCVMLFVFTQIYQSRTFMTILYYNPTFIAVQKEVLLIILFNELMSNVFFRTRSTLYYAPKYIVIYYLLFFLYFEGTRYGYYASLINILWLTCLTTILGFIYFYEIPAVQEWNPDSFYTPKLTRPRTFYFPLSQTEWTVDIPQIWTMFYPLYGRRFFDVQNLALVDDNQELLNNYLHGNVNAAEQLV